MTTQYEVHTLVKDYADPEGPVWAPKLDHKGDPIRYWERRQAETVCNIIAASITGRATRIVAVEID